MVLVNQIALAPLGRTVTRRPPQPPRPMIPSRRTAQPSHLLHQSHRTTTTTMMTTTTTTTMTATTMTMTMTTKSHRRAWSVRARMLAGFLALLTFSLGTAGISIYLLQLTDLQQRIDESLTRATGQLSTSLESGIDPGSGQPFTSIDDVLYRAMQTVMPAPNEGLLATTNGQLRWTAPSTVPLRIEEDPDLVAYVTSAKTDGNATITTLTTAQRTYRIVVIPMSLTSDPTLGLSPWHTTTQRKLLTSTSHLYPHCGSVWPPLSPVSRWGGLSWGGSSSRSDNCGTPPRKSPRMISAHAFPSQATMTSLNSPEQ